MPPKNGIGRGRGRRDSDNESDADTQENAGTFETLRDEGEHFVHVANFKKAIDSFTKALEFNREDKQCLVLRSKCYLQLGDASTSLIDAEAALDQDKNFIRALFQKGEALYQMGDFETALVFYHRGHKSRPELQEFRLGIQKCQEAINNSIGSPEAVTLETKGDLSHFFKQDEEEKAKTIQLEMSSREKQAETKENGKGRRQGKGGGYSKPQQKKEDDRRDRRRPQTAENTKTVKQLLGELYGDKEFLERLLQDESMTGRDTPTSREVKSLILDGLEYLDTRSEFWRQQKPLYARKRDRELQQGGGANQAGKQSNPTKYVLKNLEEIDEAQSRGKYKQSLEKAKKTLKTVQSWSDDEVANRPEIIANLHSQIGNAYLEMGNYDLALDHHEQDQEIGEQENLEEAKSRALDNMGRVYARKGDFKSAVKIWQKKVPLSKSALESTWLYHEIGRCHLEMDDFDMAREYGEKSLSSAREADDDDWTLHATVLIAQSEVKLGQFQSASDSFEQALELSRTLGDRKAEDAIKLALEDVNNQIVLGIKEPDDDRRSQRSGSRSPLRRRGRSRSRSPERSRSRSPKRSRSRSRSPTQTGDQREDTKASSEGPVKESTLVEDKEKGDLTDQESVRIWSATSSFSTGTDEETEDERKSPTQGSPKPTTPEAKSSSGKSEQDVREESKIDQSADLVSAKGDDQKSPTPVSRKVSSSAEEREHSATVKETTRGEFQEEGRKLSGVDQSDIQDASGDDNADKKGEPTEVAEDESPVITDENGAESATKEDVKN